MALLVMHGVRPPIQLTEMEILPMMRESQNNFEIFTDKAHILCTNMKIQ